MRSTEKKPLWTCPNCGAKLVARNMWHSCGAFTLGALFVRCEPTVRKTFDVLTEAVKMAVEDVTIIPQKTRIVFQLRTRFISVYPRKDYLLAGFVFTAKNPHDRFIKIEGPITGAYVHYSRLGQPRDVDATVEAWIKRALPYGRQDRALGKLRE